MSFTQQFQHLSDALMAVDKLKLPESWTDFDEAQRKSLLSVLGTFPQLQLAERVQNGSIGSLRRQLALWTCAMSVDAALGEYSFYVSNQKVELVGTSPACDVSVFVRFLLGFCLLFLFVSLSFPQNCFAF